MALDPAITITDEIASWIETTGGNHAMLLITVDAYLRPHVMMLARDELCLRSRERLFVAVGKTSRSAENLRARASATLAIYDSGLACVIKTRVTPGPALAVPGVVAYELTVEDVRLDAPAASEPTARLVSGLRFDGRAERLDIREALKRISE